MHLHRVSAGAETTPKHRARAARHVTPRHATPVSHPNPTLSTPSLDLGSEAPAVERIGSAGLRSRPLFPADTCQSASTAVRAAPSSRSLDTLFSGDQKPSHVPGGYSGSCISGLSSIPCHMCKHREVFENRATGRKPPIHRQQQRRCLIYGRLWQPGTLYSRLSTRIHLDLRAHARTHLENGEPGVGLATEGLQFTLSLA